MKKIQLYLLVVLVTTFFTGNFLSGQITSKEVDSLVVKAMDKFKVVGVAVAIVKDGKVIHKKGYGVRSIITKQKVDEKTNFQIASNSKAFTTAALAILVDEGRLSWKDKVKKYIPDFKMYNDYVTENFMVEDLLCHRSGLGLGAGDLMFLPDGSDFTIKDVMTCFQYFKPASAFRTKWDYDNLLYLIAGEIIARVSGISWEQFVQTRIMIPLQMNNTYPSVQRLKDYPNVAMPHSTLVPENVKIKSFKLFEQMGNGAAGGILSNVEDMSKWMIMQLNKGMYGDKLEKQLFTEERHNEMWKIHTVRDANPNPRYNSHFAGYGLGWFLNDMKGNLSVWHTGGLPGMLSIVSLIPDLKLGIVILTNTEDGGGSLFSAVSSSIIDSYLGLDKFDYVADYAKRLESQSSNADSVVTSVWKQVDMSKNNDINQQDYIGIYEDNWFGKIAVFLKGDQLWFKSYRSPKLNGQMSFYKANTFAIKWEYQDMPCEAFAIFSLDEEGKAQSIKMKGISPTIDFSFDFQDLDLQRVKEEKVSH
jgi:CubicO group peptidase (beta-lactamase class C family)